MTQKEKIKHERVLKLKKIGFWTLNIVSYILAGLFLIVLIISLSTPKKQNVSPRGVNNLYNEQITEVINDIPNNVVYDDENYSITLNGNELQNYSFDNFYSYLEDNTSTLTINCTDIEYSGTFNFNSGDNYYIAESNSYNLLISDNYTNFVAGVGWDNSFTEIMQPYHFYLYQTDENLIDLSIYDFVLTDEDEYEYLKNAIELDIQANETSETQTIFESLTNVLSNFITTLNSGITSVLNLFWDSTNLQLTLLGNLTTIVIGVAVCFFLFRLVIGLIRLRG